MLSLYHMPILLKFDGDDCLPEGDYELTIDELRSSLLVVGPGDQNWDRSWRAELVDNLEIVVQQLWQAGITEIFVDGSFVERRDHPNDIDVYFECDLMQIATGQLEARLNELDPRRSWTWDDDRRAYDEKTGKRQLPMWFAYHVEAWPDFGQGSTVIHPITERELTHPELFRITRNGARAKGIIKIIRQQPQEPS